MLHSAGSKRKPSPDSGNESSSGQTISTPQKRPRLFFTEEQKAALRNAYTADPYPNQAAIERLAADVGVGVKTVVNWFHNHRMRAKQQTTHVPRASLSPGGAVQLTAAAVKMEEDTTSSYEQTTLPSKNGLSSSPCFSDSIMHVNDRLCAESLDQVSTALSGSSSIANRSTVVNKRKRARPHKLLSQRTVRDKTDGTTKCISSNDLQPCVDGDVPIDLSVLHSTVTSDGLALEAISGGKNEAAISDVPLTNDDWRDSDREKNIERLQKNLTQEPSDEWEF